MRRTMRLWRERIPTFCCINKVEVEIRFLLLGFVSIYEGVDYSKYKSL